MKLDKIKFARVIATISHHFDLRVDDDFIERLDYLIDINVEPVKTDKVSPDLVDELLKQLNAPDGFIPAIKAYRVLTGAGLKESKEAIERYRSVSNFQQKAIYDATLGDILHQVQYGTK